MLDLIHSTHFVAEIVNQYDVQRGQTMTFIRSRPAGLLSTFDLSAQIFFFFLKMDPNSEIWTTHNNSKGKKKSKRHSSLITDITDNQNNQAIRSVFIYFSPHNRKIMCLKVKKHWQTVNKVMSKMVRWCVNTFSNFFLTK